MIPFVAEPTLEAVDRIRGGLPWTLADQVRARAELPDSRFAAILGMSPRTLTRCRKARAALDIPAGDRLYRLIRVIELAAKVFRDEKAGVSWLKRPQRGLGGCVPLDLLDTGPGSKSVDALLNRIRR